MALANCARQRVARREPRARLEEARRAAFSEERERSSRGLVLAGVTRVSYGIQGKSMRSGPSS